MKNNFIQLKNGMKFMILSAHELDGERYFYLASVTKKIKYVFAKLVDEAIELVEDNETIVKLQLQLLNRYNDKMNSESEK